MRHSVALLLQYCVRYNLKMAIRHRAGFPSLQHFDTHLIDKLQLLVERNHNVQIFPGWLNSSDYADTPESFIIVPLNCAALAEAVQKKEVPQAAINALTPDEKWLAKRMGVKLPFLPVIGMAEKALFNVCIRQGIGANGGSSAALDFDKMAFWWCDHIGLLIKPKLPSQLRAYFATCYF
jgi:hypothetical protein